MDACQVDEQAKVFGVVDELHSRFVEFANGEAIDFAIDEGDAEVVVLIRDTKF